MDNTYMYTNKSSKPRLLTLGSLLLVESIMMKHHPLDKAKFLSHRYMYYMYTPHVWDKNSWASGSLDNQ